ncbi:MAG TPA: molybdate ABC transporter substrate-binding protein [Candidatus Limnocylindrales bacterium]|nr:molybdate ABC transporter substrate-binding protein [Candidatus Limnocylindrales bacterium]
MISALVPLRSQEVTIAAASDLQFVLPEMAARFERQTGIKVKLSFGSSGNFYSQIQNGAPFDLFFSADANYPRSLETDGLVVPGTVYDYAVGKLVLWVPHGSKLKIEDGLRCLLAPEVARIAIANPAHAPYGRAAQSALRNSGLAEKLKHKLILGENISQTAQFVQTGSAEAGFLALALALSPNLKNAGRFVPVDSKLYPPLLQSAALLKAAREKQAARKFLKFVSNPEGKGLLRQYGFEIPAENR